MRRLLLCLVTLCYLAGASIASAHPLGNFTINRYSRLELSGSRLYVFYVLDMAEIPTFQQRQEIPDRERLGDVLAARIGRGVWLRVDGRSAALQPLRHVIGFPPGVAGLRTTRLELVLAATLPHRRDVKLDYGDRTFSDRIGWKEIVARGEDGARVLGSSVPTKSISAELRAYPKDLLQSPLSVTSARLEVSPGAGVGRAPGLSSPQALDTRVTVRNVGDRGFTALIAHHRLGPGLIALSLLAAFFWGAVHTFSPGHGKAIVASYLVGSRGTARHALLLSLIVTTTHTAGVFALGGVTLGLSQFIVPEQLYPWLNLVAAVLVLGVGLSILRIRYRAFRPARGGHDHHHHHHHHHHELEDGEGSVFRRLLGVGLSAGIVPCPTALVVLLAAVSLHRVGYGLLLIVAFSVGLAATFAAIGLLAVTAKSFFSRVSFEGQLMRALPTVSALVVIVLGVAMTFRALPKVT